MFFSHRIWNQDIELGAAFHFSFYGKNSRGISSPIATGNTVIHIKNNIDVSFSLAA